MTSVSSVGGSTAPSNGDAAAVLAIAREINKISYVSEYSARRYLGSDEKESKLKFRRMSMKLHSDRFLSLGLSKEEETECTSAFSKLVELHSALHKKPVIAADGTATAGPSSGNDLATITGDLGDRLQSIKSAVAEAATNAVEAVKDFAENPKVRDVAAQAKNIGLVASVGAAAFWTAIKVATKK